MYIELNLIKGNVLSVDGAKIRVNAGRGRNHTSKEHEKELLGIDQNIDKLVEECKRDTMQVLLRPRAG